MSSSGIAVRRADMGDLSADLLDSILKKMNSVTDYIRFGAVCREWRSVALQQKHRRIINSSYHHQPPLLILPYDNSGDLHLKFYDFSADKVYYNSDKIAIPSAYRNRHFYCGSSFGWLAFAESDFSITLFNPFTNAPRIRLPPVMRADVKYEDISDPQCLIYKFFLSCDPSSSSDYVVAVIFDNYGYAAFIRSDQESWTGINKSFIHVSDILFSNGRLFAINWLHQLIAVDCYSSDSLGIETSVEVVQEQHVFTANIVAVMHSLVPAVYQKPDYTRKSYIVDMGDQQMLHVDRFYLMTEDELDDSLQTVAFKLYKLQNGEWVEIHSIGDFVLFLGTNASVITSSSTPSFKPNSIYYTDDIFYRCAFDPPINDFGIFDIHTKIIHNLCHLPPHYSTPYEPSAIWISPPPL